MVVSGRRACGVYCPLSTLYVLWCVFQCGVRVVLLCCVVGCGMAVAGMRCVVLSFVFLSLSVFLSLFFFVLVFGVVRAQLCEHARYPRTPLCFLVVFSSLCSSPFHALLFFCWNGGGGFTTCRSVVLA